MAQKYLSLSEAQVTLACLVALNGVVFAAWQIPRLLPWMQRWFMHHPAHPRTITLLTSCFSHQGFLHLSMNMVGLWSFGTYLHDTLGREQFIALYLSMGIGANVISHCLSTALRSTRPMIPTLGASGAIYGLLSGMAYLHPQSSITMIFLPFLPVTLGHAMPALMALDVAGIIFKWRTLDHYAHLAGASFGLSYMAYGHHYVWQPLVQTMMEMRTC
ncbi:hypothetical protein BDF14DRAFT_1745541 [Spinellus fusiger]|nr:hypothetical protein BDF14DRAFT_1745541 [Spinellus fusiger]